MNMDCIKRYAASALIVMAMANLAFASDTEGKFIITPVGFDNSGILQLKISFDFKNETVIYSWCGNIYPMLDLGLFCEASSTDSSKSILIEQVALVMPVVPHHLDVVKIKHYEYDNPLRLRVIEENGKPYSGCIKIRLNYNSNVLTKYNPDLYPLNIYSNTIVVCNDDELKEK